MDRYCGVVAGLVLDIGWGEGQINGLLIYKLLDQGRSVPPWWRRLCISQRFRNLSLMGLDGTLGWGRKQVDSMGRKKHTFMSLVARGRNVDCRLSTKIYPLLCDNRITAYQRGRPLPHFTASLATTCNQMCNVKTTWYFKILGLLPLCSLIIYL